MRGWWSNLNMGIRERWGEHPSDRSLPWAASRVGSQRKTEVTAHLQSL
jgi:hypothetical protein